MVSVQYFAAVSPLPKIPNNGKSPAGINAVTDSGTNSKTLQNGILGEVMTYDHMVKEDIYIYTIYNTWSKIFLLYTM